MSQIVTPDLQPEGQLSLSFQAQAPEIANPYQLQAEIGITSWLEAAVFQGLSPGEQIFGTQVGLVNHGPWLTNHRVHQLPSTCGSSPQVFLEGVLHDP